MLQIFGRVSCKLSLLPDNCQPPVIMTAIERTAYPSFKQQPSPKELAELYTPTAEDIAFAKTYTDSFSGRFRLLVLLKAFQRLGYFPHPELITATVINHLRAALKLPARVSAIASLRTHRRYQQAIRTYLGVKPYSAEALKVAASAIAPAAEVMEHPADLINVGIETLVKERYELPAFSTLDRKARQHSLARQHPIISTGVRRAVPDGANLPGAIATTGKPGS